MAITESDIKLMQPERLTDDADGGGQMTGLEVIDGDINNLFEDISRVNRTYGNVSVRKAFLKVDTATADLYLDAHSILSAQPQDPNVSGLLFTTEDFYDERAAARQRIESFVISGPVTGLNLRGNQLQGQQTIITYAPAINNVPAPEIGETYILRIGDDISTEQYVKVINVEHSQETFTYTLDSGGPRTFEADQYILQLSAELQRDYPATDPHPRPAPITRVYSTQPAISAKYYGTTTLAESVEAGATSVRVSETFAPIIPTASSETPVIDQRPGGFLAQVVPASEDTIAIPVSVSSGNSSLLPTAVVPGSVTLTGVSGAPYTDEAGAFVNGDGNPGNLEGTAIDYRTGAISWAGSVSGSGTVTYTPGALRQQLPNTGRIDIDETNRNFNYVLSLDPAPARTTFHASYQYLGKWYTLQDDGTGHLVGDGSGQINYDTGSIVMTLQAQPDAGSVIFYRWTEGSLYSLLGDDAYSGGTPATLQLRFAPLRPNRLTITWTSGGNTLTATDDGNGGLLGDATGSVDYSAGLIVISGADKPDAGTHWTVDYTHKDGGELTNSQTVPDNENRSDIVLQAGVGAAPGSITFQIWKSVERRVVQETTGGGEVVLSSGIYWRQAHMMSDDGNGNIFDRRDRVIVGTVNYSTGEIVIAGNQFLKVHEN